MVFLEKMDKNGRISLIERYYIGKIAIDKEIFSWRRYKKYLKIKDIEVRKYIAIEDALAERRTKKFIN